MMHALDFWLDEPRRVVVAGDAAVEKFQELLRAAHSVYQPNKIILGNTGAVESFARTLAAKDGAEVSVCQGNACQLPVNTAAAVVEQLK